MKNIVDNLKIENELYNEGYCLIAGVDEVGRGPLIGPVVTAAVILPIGLKIDGLTDSKKLTEKKRDYYFDIINKNAIAVSIGLKDEKIIDDVNIYQATKLAMYDAINGLKTKPDYILIDAMKLDLDIPNQSIIKGDYLSQSIAAASVIAKVTRDRMMIELDNKYPMYEFKSNKGYPTKKHIEAINKYGLIEGYRKTFGPVKDYLIKEK